MDHRIRANSDPGTSFCALIRFYLEAAYYSDLSSASPVVETAALVWNFGYPLRTESPSGYVYAIETLQRNNAPSLCDSAPLQTVKHRIYIGLVTSVICHVFSGVVVV